MRDDKTLAGLAESKIADLRDQGYTVNDADVVLINHLAHEIASPTARRELARGRPVEVGGVWLWPFTVNSQHWFNEIGCKMYDPMQALAFAFANGSNSDIWEMKFPQTKVALWYSRITATDEQIIMAISEVHDQDSKDELPVDEKDKPKNNNTCIVQLSEMMHALHGGESEQWERYLSCSYINDLADILSDQASESGGLNAMLTSRANLALHYAIREIKDRQKQ